MNCGARESEKEIERKLNAIMNEMKEHWKCVPFINRAKLFIKCLIVANALLTMWSTINNVVCVCVHI
jgi:hypothetical protein